MPIRLFASVALVAALTGPVWGQSLMVEPEISFPPTIHPEPIPVLDQLRSLGHPHGIEPINAACCKICSKGKACGNSCIQRRLTCHKPPGCACDADPS